MSSTTPETPQEGDVAPMRSFAEAMEAIPGFETVGEPVALFQRPRSRIRYRLPLDDSDAGPGGTDSATPD